jgi:hypothetical protein
VDRFGTAAALWTGGAVRKIIQNDQYWALLSDQGIVVSRDLIRWETRNEGLPVKTIKLFDGGEKSFSTQIQEIKDLEVLPGEADIMVCAVKDRVFLSRNGGRNWESLGMPTNTNGIKAVAAARLPELTVFVSHGIYGVYYIQPDKAGAKWTELNRGLEKLETTNNSDEVSDIIPVLLPDGNGAMTIYASQTFRRRVYRLDWEAQTFVPLWSDAAPFGTVDSLDSGRGTMRFVREGTVMELTYPGAENARYPLLSWERPDILEAIRAVSRTTALKPSCIVMRENNLYTDAELINLSELWLLDPDADGKYLSGSDGARGREGLYLPVNHAMEMTSLKPYLDIIAERNLDMVVIDMKDDLGRLRFTPEDPAIAAKGRTFRPVDIDAFLTTMKERVIYTAARIVVFKDGELARREGGKYAVWDSRHNKAWAGYYDKRQPRGTGKDPDSAFESEILPSSDPAYETLRTYYDETWVDPYSEEVWDYIAAIAVELHRRGFDEIQFDYIRFPTDGENLADASYRWREPGMDMESAMLSFLRHVRARLDAPISIDIYGANGWYRTGARTGQEVELLANYVDVISPMYYPSHFEQDFLAQAPAELRPYRIYYQGTLRTARIGRGQIIVRPYVQAFYLNVSYDRKYYDETYVRREVEGVRDAGMPGLTYWNNSGRYGDIPF